MAMDDDDNNVNGNGVTGNKIRDDSDGTTGDNNNDDNYGNNEGNRDGNSAMGSSATGYDNDDDGDG